jgi:hypothetical protein
MLRGSEVQSSSPAFLAHLDPTDLVVELYAHDAFHRRLCRDARAWRPLGANHNRGEGLSHAETIPVMFREWVSERMASVDDGQGKHRQPVGYRLYWGVVKKGRRSSRRLKRIPKQICRLLLAEQGNIALKFRHSAHPRGNASHDEGWPDFIESCETMQSGKRAAT